MSEFADLLEEYLDFEDYEFKEEDYDEVEENNKQAKTSSPFTAEDAISMNRFVSSYLGYQMDCSSLYHCGLRELEIPDVIGVDNNFANKNPEYVKRGFLLIVIDAKGNRGTYLNPVYIMKFLKRDDIEQVYNTFKKLKNVEFKKLTNYYEKYRQAKLAYEEIEKFTVLLEETHKINKVKKLERRKKND